MGWLREFMTQAGVRSFGELARQALGHPEWPEDTRAQSRSLEAILGRLDRLEDVDWLADRPGVQQILASVLKVSVAEIRTVLLGSVALRPTVTRLRLDDLSVGRSLSLLDEALPPGIPHRISLPASWSRCCWIGAAGSGFSLASLWLRARGLAQTETIASVDEIARLPVTGPPLYVEIEASLALSFFETFRGTQALCVAVCTPDESLIRAATSQRLDWIRSPAIADCLERVLDWVLARITARKEFGRQFLLDWLRAVPLRHHVLQTLGDALGLLGACLDGSIEPNLSITKESLLRQWLEQRTADLARERHRDILGLRRMLPDILVEIAQTVLTDDTRPLQAARGIDEWLDLIPEQHRRGPDIDWLTTRLVSENLPLRKPDLERAAQRLPPGAHRIIVALRELHLLQPTSVTQFALRPHFLGRLVHEVANDRVASSSPLFWGESLLRPFARESIVASLITRGDEQPEALAEDVLDQVDLENPALVCAFETSFVLLGLSSLSGGELPDQTAAQLLMEQAALTLYPPGGVPCARTIPRESNLLSDLSGAFFLAAWSLSETASDHRQTLPALLDPWHTNTLSKDWEAVLDNVADTIQAALPGLPSWLPGAIRLLDRLRHCVGSQLDNSSRPHCLFLAGSLLDAVELGVLEWQPLEELLCTPWQVEFLQVSMRQRKTAAPQLAQTILAAWLEAGCPPTGLTLFAGWEPGLFDEIPPAILARCLLQAEPVLPATVMSQLQPTVWHAWLTERRSLPLEHEAPFPWRVAPAFAAESALSERSPVVDEIRAIVWQRFPELAIRQVDRHRTVAPQIAADWLSRAPLQVATAVAKHALRSNWLRAASVLTIPLARLVHEAVVRRVDGWPVAYDCLNQLERIQRQTP